MARSDPTDTRFRLSPLLVALMAFACGAMVANLYYAQTLIDTIGTEIGLSPGAAGMITTLTQLGYGAGLFLLVPLGDLFENRRLTLIATAGTALGAAWIAVSGGPVSFLVASLLTGVCATGAQVLIPLATHLSSEERQGRTIGLIMSGLLTGIMLARPLASFVAEHAGWRAIFWISAGLMAAIGVALAATLPERRPNAGIGYREIIRSMGRLFLTHRQLRLRAFYQAVTFAAFNLFWTAAPLFLINRLDFSQDQVALFALAGAGGALAAPLAGWLGDRKLTWWTTLGAMVLLTGGFAVAGFTATAGSVIAFTLTAVVIDAAVQLNQITGQKIIFALSQEARSRVNAVYMTTMFVIGASGSVIGSVSYHAGGWPLSAAIGTGLGALILAVFLAFDRVRKGC